MFVYNPSRTQQNSVLCFRSRTEIVARIRMGNNSKDRNADSSGSEEEEEYVVEKILNRRVKHGKVTHNLNRANVHIRTYGAMHCVRILFLVDLSCCACADRVLLLLRVPAGRILPEVEGFR